MTDPLVTLDQVQAFIRDYRARTIAQDVATIAAERARLDGCNDRTLRRMAWRSIRRAQRSLARAADYIIATNAG